MKGFKGVMANGLHGERPKRKQRIIAVERNEGTGNHGRIFAENSGLLGKE